MENPRDLTFNRDTGNFIDTVAAAYAIYMHKGGDMVFQQFHDSKLCPQHDMCTSCYNLVVSR